MLANEIEALRSAYDIAVVAFDAETEHEQLLCSLAAIMQQRLSLMHAKGQVHYTLHLADVEAMAFCQLWHLFKNLLGIYEANVVQKVLKHINRELVHA